MVCVIPNTLKSSDFNLNFQNSHHQRRGNNHRIIDVFNIPQPVRDRERV
jgi:hypothetical protein